MRVYKNKVKNALTALLLVLTASATSDMQLPTAKTYSRTLIRKGHQFIYKLPPWKNYITIHGNRTVYLRCQFVSAKIINYNLLELQVEATEC